MGKVKVYTDRRQLRKNRVKVSAHCRGNQHSRCAVLDCECKNCDHGVSWRLENEMAKR